MKTAMQELIEWHRKSMRSYSETNKMIETLLEKEKEQIIDAHLNGQSDHHFSLESRMAEAEQHYKEKYNQNK
jgi:hypothetical protein